MTIMFKWFVWVIVFIPFCVTLWDLLLSEEMNLTVEAPMMELSREPKKSRSMAELARNQNIFITNVKKNYIRIKDKIPLNCIF